MILNQVQALGELHTARYSYQHVFEQQSSREPETWTRYVPGMSDLVVAGTRNTALMETTGWVEAGVDLSQATVKDSKLVLPRPKIYPPHVNATVRDAHRGLFWRDDNIALRAVRATEADMEKAALRQGILADAERNAQRQVMQLVPEIRNYRIEFE